MASEEHRVETDWPALSAPALKAGQDALADQEVACGVYPKMPLQFSEREKSPRLRDHILVSRGPNPAMSSNATVNTRTERNSR